MKRKHRGVLITSFLAIATLAYVLFGFVPGHLEVREMRERLREQQLLVVESERLKSVIKNAQDDVHTAEVYAEDWRRTAALQDNLVLFFGQITSSAADSGVVVRQLTPQPPVTMKLVRQIPVQLRMEGKFQNLFQFVRSIESLDQTIWITQLQILPNAVDSEVLRCELTLTIFADNHDFSG